MSATIHDHAAGADPKPQRDARRRFSRGNKGGPGNPFGRRLAQLREILLRSATEQNVERLANMLMEKAFAGDMAAAKLLKDVTSRPPSRNGRFGGAWRPA